MSFSASASLGLGLSASASIGGLQTSTPFQTLPTSISRTPLYTLALVSPGQGSAIIGSYTFPLGPQDIHKEPLSMDVVSYVQGQPSMLGIQPMLDLWGQTPPVYVIRGTTGSKYHSADGFSWDGLQSIQALQALVAQYHQLNAAQVQANSSQLYSLEFYDYFMGEYWIVTPVGPQPIDQSASAPIIGYYTLRLVALGPVSSSYGAQGNSGGTNSGVGGTSGPTSGTGAPGDGNNYGTDGSIDSTSSQGWNTANFNTQGYANMISTSYPQ